MFSSRFVLIFLFFSILFTRFYGLTWGNNYAFHPDENNMAAAVSQMSLSNLNPHFFAYGQFPLYLAFFSQKIAKIPNSFLNSIYTLRFWSAFFSSLAVIVLYLLFPNKLFTLLLIFTPGLIQMSHFGTTESLLLFIFVLTIYLSFKKHYILASIILGIGIATKISSLVFICPILLSIMKNKKYTYLIYIVPIILLFSIIFSPYNLIEFNNFISALKYETSVATGSLPVFYTQQFVSKLPYIFQFTHIFPYAVGLPILALSIFSLFTNYRLLFTQKNLILFLSCLIYFLYFGQVFVKWTRFMSPIFFIFPLLASYFIIHQKPVIKYFLTIICLIPGFIFLSQYFRPDIRVVASDWITQNLPPDSKILSESGNVVNLPLSGNFNINNYDFYNRTPPPLSDYDYILIPSRRVFKNNFYPDYYQKLFNGTLGYRLIKQFSPPPEFFLDPENAEETWSVFDHPTIRIFKNLNL